VIVLENRGPVEITPQLRDCALVISRFLGLFMSSARLEVNKGQQFDLHDLYRARQIQLNFLPKELPRTHRCEVYGLNTSSKLVGGDYFDYFESEQDTIRCILADACGHGMAAALTMSNFRGLLQSEILRHRDIPELFERLNSMLHFDDELIQYLTGVFFSLEEQSGRLEYVNAGHYEPIVFGSDGQIRTLPGGGPPLGMFKSSKYPVGQVYLHSGDLVALFTDGLVDIQSPDEQYFGVEGIVSNLLESRNGTLEEAAGQLLGRARAFSGSNDFEDDVTVFLLRVR
jgi:sigma-B regulation protein RsbU (phosphoserine phosphatase)